MKIKDIRRTASSVVEYAVYKLQHFSTDSERLVIYDDTFPCLLSPFRVAEFNAYLDHFKRTDIYSTMGRFYEERKKYESHYPQHVNKIFKFNRHINYSGKLGYIVFLHNVYAFLPYIEKYRLPFVFELYPGGYFQIDEERSDFMLRKVFDSKYFRKVIVTQKISREYLLQKNFCRPDRIEFIYGVAIPIDWYVRNRRQKKYFPTDKRSFDICFVANKYSPQGKDKGYDIFIDVAKEMHRKKREVRFHVVGTFSRSDIDVAALGDSIQFYGSQLTDFFPEFYSNMDIIVSPNRPFVLDKGAFDGFLTGCCIEAGICGVAIFATDPLNLNSGFTNNVNMVIINTTTSDIVDKIIHYLDNYERLYELSKRGEMIVEELFGEQRQINPRLSTLKTFLD